MEISISDSPKGLVASNIIQRNATQQAQRVQRSWRQREHSSVQAIDFYWQSFLFTTAGSIRPTPPVQCRILLSLWRWWWNTIVSLIFFVVYQRNKKPIETKLHIFWMPSLLEKNVFMWIASWKLTTQADMTCSPRRQGQNTVNREAKGLILRWRTIPDQMSMVQKCCKETIFFQNLLLLMFHSLPERLVAGFRQSTMSDTLRGTLRQLSN